MSDTRLRILTASAKLFGHQGYAAAARGPRCHRAALIDHVFKLTDSTISAFFGRFDVHTYRLAPASRGGTPRGAGIEQRGAAPAPAAISPGWRYRCRPETQWRGVDPGLHSAAEDIERPGATNGC